jgi:hypothetical protein
VDSDNDGVMDDMDRCPDAGLLALKDDVRIAMEMELLI